MSWHPDHLWQWHPKVSTGDARTLGQRAADLMKQMLATWTALILVLVFICGWMIWNSHLSGHRNPFDPFPWILLNLFLSCFAALQCFVLLIANKRGEQIAAQVAQGTFENTLSVQKLVEQNIALTEQVHQLSESVRTKLGC